MATTFIDGKNKVFNFMESVEHEKELLKEKRDRENTVDYKLKLLEDENKKAKDYYVNNVFLSLYKDAIPLNDEYKDAYDDELDKSYDTFIQRKYPKGIQYYINEGPLKKSPFVNNLREKVNEALKDDYRDKSAHIENINAEELKFDKDDKSVNRRISDIGSDLSVPEISQAVKNNVKKTALDEIVKAKKVKADDKELEADLAQDPKIHTEESVQRVLSMKGYPKIYTPTLFEGVMINKLNKYQALEESGSLPQKYTYNALADYRESTNDELYASAEELAFIEAVKEYTALSMLKALKMESYDGHKINELADAYARGKI